MKIILHGENFDGPKFYFYFFNKFFYISITPNPYIWSDTYFFNIYFLTITVAANPYPRWLIFVFLIN